MACVYQAETLLLLTLLWGSTPLPRIEATAMNISDMRTRVEGAEKSSLVTRIADLDETPVLTLVDTSEHSDGSEMPDPLIQALW